MQTAAQFLYVVRMNVADERETRFNQVYDTDHVPHLLTVPGLRRVTRYRTHAPGSPRYLALYEIEDSELPTSEHWRRTRDLGDWATQVRPYTVNRDAAVYRRLSDLDAPSTFGSLLLAGMADDTLRTYAELATQLRVGLRVVGTAEYASTGDHSPRYWTFTEVAGASRSRRRELLEQTCEDGRLLWYERIFQHPC
jgi:hypothetical protein